MANEFLPSGPSRSELMSAILQQQSRSMSQQPNPQSGWEAAARTGSTLVDAYMQKKLMDEELERRSGQHATDMAALQAYAVGQQGIDAQAAVPASGATEWQNPDFDPNAVAGQQQVTSIDPARQGEVLGMGIDPTQQMVGGDYVPAQEEIIGQEAIDPMTQQALALAFEQNPNMSPEAANNLVNMYSDRQITMNHPSNRARPVGSPKTITGEDGIDYELQQMYDPQRIGDPNTIDGSGIYTVNMGRAADLGTRGTSGVKIKEAQSTADIDVEKDRLIREGASANETIDQAYTAIGNINAKSNIYNRIITAIDNGADTGVIEGYFKSVKAATIELEQLQSELGIQIIGDTTFGSLSEDERRFAVNTALPTDLEPAALRDWVLRKKAAQDKMRNIILNQVAFLDAGNSKADLLRITSGMPMVEPAASQGGDSIADIIARNQGQ